MADLSGFLQSTFGLAQVFQGAAVTQAGYEAQANAIIQGGELSAQGYQLTAAGFREAAKSQIEINNFNILIDRENTLRRLNAASTQFQRLLGSQRIQLAANGIAATSKSAMALQSEVLSLGEKTFLQIKVDAENASRARKFETDIRVNQLENRAIAADYQAQVSRVIAANNAAEARFQGDIAQYKASQQLSAAVPTLLGQLFD